MLGEEKPEKASPKFQTLELFCRSYRISYVCCAGIGVVFYFLFRYTSTEVLQNANLMRLAEKIDYILLPRTLLEYGPIEDALDSMFLEFAVYCNTFVAFSCTSLIAAGLSSLVHCEEIPEKLSAKSLAAAIFSSTVIIFRPAVLKFYSFSSNVISADGLYLVRESIINSVCYFHLFKVMAHVAGVIAKRKVIRRPAE